MSAIMDNDFPTWLKDKREKLGWSQSDLARRADVSRQAISDYEGRKRKYYDDDILRRIAAAFKMAEEDVFRKAGKLSGVPDQDEWVNDMSNKIKLIRPSLREIAERFIDSMVEGEEAQRPNSKPRVRTQPRKG